MMKKHDEIKKGLAGCKPGRCAPDCPYGDTIGCVQKMHRDTLAMIQQLEAQVPKWISMKNPPKEAGEYIVLIRYPDGRSIRTFNIFHPDVGWCPNDLVEAVQTHWLSFYSLPEPPKEDELNGQTYA